MVALPEASSGILRLQCEPRSLETWLEVGLLSMLLMLSCRA